MVDLVICSAAAGDYAEALTWYVARSTQAAEGFEAEFAEALNTIAADPQRFPLCDSRHRYYLMRHYPFQIIFREYHRDFVVIAVAHTKRQPGYWADR
jgi:plasmid stabilization system protein ParE